MLCSGERAKSSSAVSTDPLKTDGHDKSRTLKVREKSQLDYQTSGSRSKEILVRLPITTNRVISNYKMETSWLANTSNFDRDTVDASKSNFSGRIKSSRGKSMTFDLPFPAHNQYISSVSPRGGRSTNLNFTNIAKIAKPSVQTSVMSREPLAVKSVLSSSSKQGRQSVTKGVASTEKRFLHPHAPSASEEDGAVPFVLSFSSKKSPKQITHHPQVHKQATLGAQTSAHPSTPSKEVVRATHKMAFISRSGERPQMDSRGETTAGKMGANKNWGKMADRAEEVRDTKGGPGVIVLDGYCYHPEEPLEGGNFGQEDRGRSPPYLRESISPRDGDRWGRKSPVGVKEPFPPHLRDESLQEELIGELHSNESRPRIYAQTRFQDIGRLVLNELHNLKRRLDGDQPDNGLEGPVSQREAVVMEQRLNEVNVALHRTKLSHHSTAVKMLSRITCRLFQTRLRRGFSQIQLISAFSL